MEHIFPEESAFPLDTGIVKIKASAISFWLQRFVLEARKANKQQYCLLIAFINYYMLWIAMTIKKFWKQYQCFEQFQFVDFWAVFFILDGELKELNATGKFVHKKEASVITEEMENILWVKGLLGDHSPQVLSDTMVYLIGFALLLEARKNINICDLN